MTVRSSRSARTVASRRSGLHGTSSWSTALPPIPGISRSTSSSRQAGRSGPAHDPYPAQALRRHRDRHRHLHLCGACRQRCAVDRKAACTCADAGLSGSRDHLDIAAEAAAAVDGNRKLENAAMTNLLMPPEKCQSMAEIRAAIDALDHDIVTRSEEHTSELQSLMRISYAVFCLKKKRMNRQYPDTI